MAAKYTPTAKLMAAVPPYKAQVAPPPAPVNFNFDTMPQSPITAATMLPSGAELLGYGSTAQAVPQQPMGVASELRQDPWASLYVPTYEGSQDATGQFLGNQFQLPTNQPALTATQAAAAQATSPGTSDSFVNQNGPVEGLSYHAPTTGMTPVFGKGASDFLMSVPPTMVAPPQQQYDPRRAADILRAMSFLPLASMLTGGDANYGARLMPSIASAAIGGDKAYFDEGQALNSKYLQSIAAARGKDSENRINLMKLAQDASDDDTRRATEMAKASQAKSQLDLQAAQFRENTRQGLVEDQDKRTKTSQEIMSWLSMLEPDAQIAYVKNLSPTFRAYYGINLPSDGKGGFIPLKRANPNEPSQRMLTKSLVDGWMDALMKDPEHLTDAAQVQLIRNIDQGLAELGLDPQSYFSMQMPFTNPLSPKDKAQIAAEQAKVGIMGQNAQTERMRANTYGQSVSQQGANQRGMLSLAEKREARLAAAQGSFGEMAKVSSRNLNQVEGQIRSTTLAIQKLSNGHWDSLGNKWRPNTPKEILNTEPQLREMQAQLDRLNKMRTYWDGKMWSSMQVQAGVSGQMQPAPSMPDFGLDMTGFGGGSGFGGGTPVATPGDAPVAQLSPEAQALVEGLKKSLGPQQ